MGIVDQIMADDIDVLASELLNREDPEPLDLLARAIMGAPSQDNGEVEVFVDGVQR